MSTAKLRPLKHPYTNEDLRQIRTTKLQISQPKLAELLGTTRDTINSWENGRRPISLITSLAIQLLLATWRAA